MAEMTHEEIEEKMLDLLEEVSGYEEVRDHRDEDLFALGFLDSMAAVELLVDIEAEFGVAIAPTEVEREAMNTVNLIIYQVEQRM
jgi:D-alanine--poly(phosphoribitol) ligase subunit 2